MWGVMQSLWRRLKLRAARHHDCFGSDQALGHGGSVCSAGGGASLEGRPILQAVPYIAYWPDHGPAATNALRALSCLVRLVVAPSVFATMIGIFGARLGCPARA